MNIGVIRRCLFRLIFCGLVYACLGGAIALYAQPDPCERPGGRRGDGDDLKCRIGIVLEKQQAFLDKVKAHTDQRCTSAECERLKKNIEKAKVQRNRAANAHGRATAKDYEDLTVKGNGKRKKKDGGNSGASGDSASQAQEEEDEEPVPDPAIGEDVAAELDDVIEATDDASAALDAEPTAEQALIALDQSSSPKFQASYGYGRTERTGPGLAMAAFIAFRISHTFGEVVDQVCGQTVVAGGFGGNTRAGCVPLFILAQALEHAYELLQFLDSDINDAEIEGAYERAGQVYDKVTELQVSVGGTETDIAILRTDLASHDTGVRDLLADLMAAVRANQQQVKKVIAVQRQIIRLLLQPDGRRTVDPNVLTCTGDDCPVVLACPGNECVSPVK